MKSDWYRPVLFVIGVSVLFLSQFYVFISPGENVKEPVEPKGTFTIVDTYKDRCDVVRYTDSSMATYKYFLDCSNK
jgi:hypothetical protein